MKKRIVKQEKSINIRKQVMKNTATLLRGLKVLIVFKAFIENALKTLKDVNQSFHLPCCKLIILFSKLSPIFKDMYVNIT